MNILRTMYRIFQNTHLRRGVLVVLLGAASYSIFSLYFASSLYITPPNALDTCFATTSNATLAATCLRKTMPDVLAHNSAQSVMSYTVSTTSPLSIRRNCHPIGHVVGSEMYKQTGDLESTLRRCTSSCEYGCVHGAIGAAVLSEIGEPYPDETLGHTDISLIATMGARYCERSAALCHGIGHILYIGSGDIRRALETCAPIATGYPQEACFQGVFMEAGGGSDSMLLKPERPAVPDSDYLYPCSTVAAAYRHACFQFLGEYQNSSFEKNGVTEGTERLHLAQRSCESLTGRDRSYCFEGIGTQSAVYGYIHLQPARMQSLCDRFEATTDRASCTVGVVPRFTFAGGDLLQYCERIDEPSRQKLCFMVAFQATGGRNNESLGIPACRSTTCNAAYDNYLRIRETLPDYRFGMFGI